MRQPLRQLLPTTLELWYITLAAITLLVAGSARPLLERAGLIGSTAVLSQQLSVRLDSSLNLVDSFRFTATAVNFLIWGATGLIVYSTLQAAVRAWLTLASEREFDSRHFVHPQGFTHGSYWRQVTVDALLGFVLMTLLLGYAAAYVLVIAPISIVYVQRFVLQASMHNALGLLVGVFTAFAGTLVAFVLAKFVIRHHRLTRTAT